MNQLTLFEMPQFQTIAKKLYRKGDGDGSRLAAERTAKKLTRLQSQALAAFRARPGLTRHEWRKYDPEETICRRAAELEAKGLIIRIPDENTKEKRIWAK